jgi:hypothetical protein
MPDHVARSSITLTALTLFETGDRRDNSLLYHDLGADRACWLPDGIAENIANS